MLSVTQRSIFLALTYECNQRCRFCYNSDRVASTKASMSREDFEFALKWIKEYYSPENTVIRLTGGEPTLHRDLVSFVSEIHRRDFRALLITNGTGFGKLYPELKEYSHALQVQFSVEGHTKEIHEGITNGKGSFDRLLHAIELAKGTFQINTNTTLNKLNLPHIFDVFEFLKGIGVERASLNYATPTASNQGIVPDFYAISEVYEKSRYLSDILDTEITTLMHIPMCISREGKGCAVGNGDLTIDPHLNAYPCPAVSFPDTCMGNIKRADPQLLFGAEIFRNIASELKYLPEGCRSCKYVRRCKGGCYLFWRLGLMDKYELGEEKADEIWKGSSIGIAGAC